MGENSWDTQEPPGKTEPPGSWHLTDGPSGTSQSPSLPLFSGGDPCHYQQWPPKGLPRLRTSQPGSKTPFSRVRGAGNKGPACKMRLVAQRSLEEAVVEGTLPPYTARTSPWAPSNSPVHPRVLNQHETNVMAHRDGRWCIHATGKPIQLG